MGSPPTSLPTIKRRSTAMKSRLQAFVATALLALVAVPAFPQASGHVRQRYRSGLLEHVNAAGTVIYSINPSTGAIIRTGVTKQVTRAKVGAAAGWVLGAANNLPYVATMAASQTAGTLVIPLDGLKIGDTITGFRIVAQVESAGGAVTIDAALRAVTNVAAEPTDAAIGSGMTQVSVTADTAASQAKTGLTEVVTSGKSYYLLVTATTAASTDIILQACELTVTES
jgi:hypothetical protein